MKLVGFDFDSTLVQTDLVLLDIIAEKLGYQVEPDLFSSYDIQLSCPVLSVEDVDDVIHKIGTIEYTFRIPSYDGALEFLKWYGKHNPIYIITNRSNLDPVNAYLQHNLDKATYDKVKTFYAKEKGKLCKSLGIEYFVDDHIKNIISIANYGVIPIVFRQHWNNHLSERSNLCQLVHFVNSWEDIYYFFGCEWFGY